MLLYNSLSSDSNMMEVVTIRTLAQVDYDNYGDAKAAEFMNKFLTMLR